MAQWKGHADAAHRAVPRDGVGALATFGKNMNKLPRAVDTDSNKTRTHIGAHLVHGAVEKMPVLADVKKNVEEYFKYIHQNLSGAVSTVGTDAVSQRILELDIGSEETIGSASPGEGAIDAVRKYIVSKQDTISECTKNLDSVKEELVQAQQRLKEVQGELADVKSKHAQASEDVVRLKGTGLTEEQDIIADEINTRVNDADDAVDGARENVDEANTDIGQAKGDVVAARDGMQKKPGAKPAENLDRDAIIKAWRTMLVRVTDGRKQDMSKLDFDRDLTGYDFDKAPDGGETKEFIKSAQTALMMFVDTRVADYPDVKIYKTLATMWKGFLTNIVAKKPSKVSGTAYASFSAHGNFSLLVGIMIFLDYLGTFSHLNGVSDFDAMQITWEDQKGDVNGFVNSSANVDYSSYKKGFADVTTKGQDFVTK